MEQVDQTFPRQGPSSGDRSCPRFRHAQVRVVHKAEAKAEFTVNTQEDETLPKYQGWKKKKISTI